MVAPAIPHRHTLVSQTIGYLTAEIERGKWPQWLPGERLLSEHMLMSRNTLRMALREMKRRGVIRSVPGLGNRILEPPSRQSRLLQSRDVAILTPIPFQQMRPALALVINELRKLLNERGCRLHEICGEQYFRANPEAALQKLTSLHPHGCWVLALSNEAQQRWFQRNRIPCVVDGSSFPEVDLPSVDLDHRALCRHAAGVLLRHGHRRIVFLSHRKPRAGDVESEDGFVTAIKHSSHLDAETTVVHYDNSVASLRYVLRRLMNLPRRPTALFVVNSYYYLTVTSWLTQRGWRIPEDISVLSRDEDPFLSFVIPRPTCYAMPPHVSARRLLESVMEWLEDGPVEPRAVRLMPDFIPGESVGPAPHRA